MLTDESVCCELIIKAYSKNLCSTEKLECMKALQSLPIAGILGSRDCSVVGHRTCDKRSQVQFLAGVGGDFSSQDSFFCADFYFCIPVATTVAHKRSQSLCLKCRWQVTAKHTCTLHMWFQITL